MAYLSNKQANWRKSLYLMGVSKGPRSLPVRKGTACAVKREGSTSAILLTSWKVVEPRHVNVGTSALGNLISSYRFCHKYPDHEDRHCIKHVREPRQTEQFGFLPLETFPKYSLKLVSSEKLREQGERLRLSTCLSYTFSGNSFKIMTWEFSNEEENHVLVKVEPKGELVEGAYRGSPVVSTEDEDRSVIGVVDCTPEGDLCLIFFTESSLREIEAYVSGAVKDVVRDETDAPLRQHESSRPSHPPANEPLNTVNTALQDNGTGVPPSAAVLSRDLSHMAIQEIGPDEKQAYSIERKPEEIKCIWDQPVPCLVSFQDLLTILKINLDPKRELGGDYRALASAFGKDLNYIWYLATKQSPVEELIRDYRPTLGFLNNQLLSKDVNRVDVSKKITAWVEKVGCSCLKCGCIR